MKSADGKQIKTHLIVLKERVARVLAEIRGGNSGAHLGVNKILLHKCLGWVHLDLGKGPNLSVKIRCDLKANSTNFYPGYNVLL